MKALWSLFTGVDAVQLEINPLAETDTGDVVSVDAKIQFDDNAQFRQKEVFAMDDTSESDPREVEAAKYNLNYIGMSGNIGCLGEFVCRRVLVLLCINQIVLEHKLTSILNFVCL